VDFNLGRMNGIIKRLELDFNVWKHIINLLSSVAKVDNYNP
jgi:hypothetical protein